MLNKLKVLDLFSGIGGFSLGLEKTGGFQTVAFCEKEKFPRKVLKKHWPDIHIYNDVEKLSKQLLKKNEIGKIDLICGGFPCQDISTVGKQKGIKNGTRSSLWFSFSRIIDEVRPDWAIIENVANLRGNGLARVLSDLWKIGYDAEWHCIPASACGAPHQRDRIWIIAYPNCRHSKQRSSEFTIRKKSDSGCKIPETMANPTSKRLSQRNEPRKDKRASCQIISRSKFVRMYSACRREQWDTEPGMGRVANGIPNRVDRIKGIENAVVPQVVEIIGMILLEFIAKKDMNE